MKIHAEIFSLYKYRKSFVFLDMKRRSYWHKMEWVKMTFEDGYELSLAYHEGVLNLLMFGEHE